MLCYTVIRLLDLSEKVKYIVKKTHRAAQEVRRLRRFLRESLFIYFSYE